ncbi:GDP-mannose 4,6-dehydratase [Pontibacter sp. G13]|uniref:GDP-mannose 4,6-dehydratase n=1 Tax=Pontibacter sp. G13 TaxID=3074898 RepID=UPI0028894985|nr:GDP-mannose 4,6-dehydratase [Pontibacter sp. G13]WNJ16864.1 GDP-mannose 4,6-dehydratase [Pontibacter sp. G13]
MNIFITGGAGFIGSNLADYFLNQGHQVKVLDNLSTGRIENLQGLMNHPSFEFVKETVTHRETMDDLIQWCDHCYHMAAPVGVKYIMENPIKTILDNVRGVDIVLDLVNQYKKRVLIASTSEIYGKSLDLLDPTGQAKLKETDYRVEGSTTNHRWAYANTKAMDEFLAFAYMKEHGTEVVLSRFFNTVGPRQLSNYGMVIPNFVKRALAGEDVVVFGTGEQRRSFMHVNDAVRAITNLMLTGKGLGEAFNVGNPFEITMNELAQKVVEKTGSSSKIVHVSYEEVYGDGYEDMNRRTADITKLRETLDFELEYDLDGILDDVISFHKEKVGI